MGRKNGLQPLTLEPGTGGRVNVNGAELITIQQSPRSPLSAKSPRSPRSPFRFNTKKSQLLHQARSQAQEQEQQLQLQQEQRPLQLQEREREREQEQEHYQRDETSSMQEVYPQTSEKDPAITIGPGGGSGSGSGIPTSQTLPSLSSYQSSSSPRTPDKAVGIKEKPSRTGFFSNYKAAKSASKLQSSSSSNISRQVNVVEDNNMSRDTDRPAMSGKVSSQDTKRSGTTHSVSSLPLQTIMLLGN